MCARERAQTACYQRIGRQAKRLCMKFCVHYKCARSPCLKGEGGRGACAACFEKREGEKGDDGAREREREAKGDDEGAAETDR